MSSCTTGSPIYELGFETPYRRSEGRPFIKTLNWYTGVGKTYNAALFALNLRIKDGVVPVFIAPLQSQVAAFISEVEGHALRDRASKGGKGARPVVPVYRLYSEEHHLNDRSFFAAGLALANWLDDTPRVLNWIEDKGGESNDEASVRARVKELRVKALSCERSDYYQMSLSDETYELAKEAFIRAARRVKSLADQLAWKLIQLEVDSRTKGLDERRVMTAVPVAEIIRRLYPLQAFLDNPGIIACTASKAEVGHSVYADKGGGKAKRCSWPTLSKFLQELNDGESPIAHWVTKSRTAARAIVILDEEEESYWYIFGQRKSIVNPGGRNDLNLVITDFVRYFDLKWPLFFQGSLGSRVYRHLEHFAGIADRLQRALAEEQRRTGARYISPDRKVALQREQLAAVSELVAIQYTDEELLTIHRQLHERNDDHSGFERFREKARVMVKLRAYISKICPPGADEFDVFRSTIELISAKKFFTMSRVTYGEVLDQPGQTFFEQSASVMDTAFQRQVEIERDTADQTLRLQYVGDKIEAGRFTLHDYLRFIIFMARVLAVTGGAKSITISKADSERYPSLASFLKDVRSLFKSVGSDEIEENETSDEELFTEQFLYESIKSVVTLEESFYQAEEYNKSTDICLTLTINSLRASPERDIIEALASTNGVFPISATGGLYSTSSGALNLAYLKRHVESVGGHMYSMEADEVCFVQKDAVEKAECRDRRVTLLDDEAPADAFCTTAAFKGLEQLFEDALPKPREEGFVPLNVYKRNEIKTLIATLDKLMSTATRSGIALCQTVQHVRKCLMGLARSPLGFVTQIDDTGDHFVIKPGRVPTYRHFAQTEDIHLILYSAARFRKAEQTKTNAVDEEDDCGQFSRELHEALDITDKKVLLWTAYGSASRGINFITTQRSVERDFELFCLVNDPYYTRHTRPGSRGFSIETFQSFCQVVRDEDPGWAAMSIGTLLYEYSRSRWSRLRVEHIIDITRTIFQALGRGERRPLAEMPHQEIYVSASAAQSVYLGTRFAPELRERASPAQRAVLNEIDRYNRDSAFFVDEHDRRRHHLASARKALLFRDFVSTTPNRFRSGPGARAIWTALFSTSMFEDPTKYLRQLGDAGVPSTYIDGCYERMPSSGPIYTVSQITPADPQRVLTDASDGTDGYRWVDLLAPPSLVPSLSPATRRLFKHHRGFPIEGDAGYRLIPQSWFGTEIMKGYIGELEFEEYISEQFNIRPNGVQRDFLTYVDVESHPLYAELYQLFDFYLQRGPDIWIAVDVKNWSRNTDALQRDQLRQTAQDKHARLSKLLPGITVHTLYVNLHGAHKFTVERPRCGSIRFMSLYVQDTGEKGWMRNTNLIEAILGT
jgi:hypothetical protein